MDGRSQELTRTEARQLLDAVGAALSGRREYVRTVGRHREDGAYVVARRGADSSGNRKVFDSFGAVERLFERLPAEFTAEDVGGTGITGSRRHMVVRHLAEHPSFDCTIARRNPLTARKTDTESKGAH